MEKFADISSFESLMNTTATPNTVFNGWGKNLVKAGILGTALLGGHQVYKEIKEDPNAQAIIQTIKEQPNKGDALKRGVNSMNPWHTQSNKDDWDDARRNRNDMQTFATNYQQNVAISFENHVDELYDLLQYGNLNNKKIRRKIVKMVEQGARLATSANEIDAPVSRAAWARWKEVVRSYEANKWSLNANNPGDLNDIRDQVNKMKQEAKPRELIIDQMIKGKRNK